MTVPATLLFIQVGRKRYQVDSLQQASEMYCAARDANMQGMSRTPPGRVVDEHGRDVARISYNGRVWSPEPWQPDARPLYDNREAP